MAGSGTHVDRLMKVPLFSGLPFEDVRRIAESAKERSRRAGDTIVEQGKPGFSFFMILEGQVEVRRDGKTLRTMGPGEFFGEMALVDEGLRTATVVATTATICLALTRADFIELLKARPEISLRMLGVMARRLRDWEEKFTP